ncbi:ABC transporter ATP-binding protein [Sulfoacidibacillus thermotolerans]|uniref:ABC transporter ATP-binding protein n=1 Tax=Sulfoacidibacillus thermotolerans TaxID=1765684 RepID=A0A2U3D9S4_SULT2|nr:ABC transporter ATP-binding protein [Sulfoacidibacillus thermotolerans]PWI58026.1 ABC transporter ATP-binding protein [Sulfoacidibacillus thermotolerans]
MKDVTKQFGQKTAVRDVTMKIAKGSAVALLGPNGAGKTTSIAMMLGLIRPTRGVVTLFGGDPLASEQHAHIGVMLQGVSVPDRLTVVETIQLFRGFYKKPLAIDRLLTAAGLEEDARVMANRLSGGKMRRLQFALALAGNPEVLFLDEPTVGMDVTARRHFWDELRRFIASGKTLLLTTHDLQEADLVADRVIVMNKGRIIADAAPESIKMQFAGRQISFVAGVHLDLQKLTKLPDVIEIKTAGRQVTIRTNNSDGLLRTLIMEQWEISDIQVTGGGLEEAFMRLTTETEGTFV